MFSLIFVANIIKLKIKVFRSQVGKFYLYIIQNLRCHTFYKTFKTVRANSQSILFQTVLTNVLFKNFLLLVLLINFFLKSTFLLSKFRIQHLPTFTNCYNERELGLNSFFCIFFNQTLKPIIFKFFNANLKFFILF